jgi:hypothetical protein
MTDQVERKEFITNEHLEFLDLLRKSGVTNMFGATPFIQNQFRDLSKNEARDILFYWMKTFSERHRRPPNDR